MDLPSLTQPQHLWWLLPALLLLWWLAQPPRPQRTILTGHPTQWLLAQASLRRRPPRFRALRWLLLCAATVGVAVAHAAPQHGGSNGPRRLCVLLDGSASMAAQAEGRARFDTAAQLVRRRLADIPAHVEVEVVKLGGGLDRWHGAAARELVAPGDPRGALPAPLAELVAVAAQPDTVVWTVTDAQHESLPAIGALSVVGRSGANASIRAVQVEDHWPLPELELSLELQNFGPAAELRIDAVGALATASTQLVAMAAGERRRVDLKLRRAAAGGRLEVRIVLPADLLPTDDVWAADLLPLPAPRIAVLADANGGPFVRAAGEALAAEMGGEVVAAEAGVAVGYLLVEGGSAALTAGSAAMATFGVQPPGTEARVWPAPTALDWDRSDPLLAGLDLSELWIAHALTDVLPPGRPLLWGVAASGASAPLCVLAAGQKAVSLHCAFRLQDSNLALLPAFPQLLRRALLAGHRATATVLGQATAIPAAEADLRQMSTAGDRELPAFGTPGQDLAPWFLLAAVCLLAGRSCLR